MIEQVKTELETKYPSELVSALLDSYIEIKNNSYLGRYEPSELNGGKFCEACCRIIQFEFTGTYTPIGTPIRNMIAELRGFEQYATTFNDSYRLHIPRILLGIYNIRNRRGVGHLGGDVTPNIADSTFIVAAASWVIAELYRIHFSVSLGEAEKVVRQLVEKSVPLVLDIWGVKRILAPGLSAREQALLFLYSEHPNGMNDSDLINFIGYSNPTRFRSILKQLDKDRMIYYDEKSKKSVILPPGIVFVEKNIPIWERKD